MTEKNTAPLTAFPKLTTEMIEQFEYLTDYIKPAEFKDQLVSLYFQFVISNPNDFPADFVPITDNLYILLEFLSKLQLAIDNRAALKTQRSFFVVQRFKSW